MKKILHIILISLFSLTVFSCAKDTDEDETTSSSSSSGTTTPTTPESYVAVGDSGTILTSPDGTTWTSRTSGTTEQLHGVTYANSTFVTVGTSRNVFNKLSDNEKTIAVEDGENQRMNENALCPGLGDYLIVQARNNHWSNHRLHSACLRLPALEYYANRPSYFGSIHIHLDHIVFVDWLHLERLTGE